MSQITINNEQAQALQRFLQLYGGSDDVTLTKQGLGGDAIFASDLVTWEVSAGGTVTSDDGEEIEIS